MSKRRLLITGFNPFGEENKTPSWQAVQQLSEEIGDFTLYKLAIPTVFEEAAEAMLERAHVIQPDVILCIGLAAGRDAVTPERIAVNIRDAQIPDNAENQPQGELIAPDGPAAYFTTVPAKKMVQAIRNAQIPGAVSNTVGTFVCNDVLYTLLHRYAGTDTMVGFIHVPFLPEQGTPSLPLEHIVSALIAAIKACRFSENNEITS